MQICKLIVISSDKVQVIQCRSENPASFVLIPTGFSGEDAQNALYMRFEWYENDIQHSAVCTFKSYDNGKLTLSPVSGVQKDETEQFHIIDTYETVEFRHVQESEIADFKQKTDNINRRFRNSLTTQIKNILSDETLTNQFLFRLLLQIDGKLDELLAHKMDGSIDGLKECKLLALSGGGLYFTSDSASAGDYFFIQSTPKYTSNFIFAALCKAKEVIKAPQGVIVISEFVHLDEISRDGMVHFVFEKEREKLKRIRANV
ncbi:hypothetical protein [Seleniivibrio sp.]|uniref:hypothetical protein n=1 Tax=Seleniivibrio sp. TaxID=2898801 RepID=UPI0025F0E77B|nr:hypothetical protein [Seleniivibrio sp.]MCD8553901.1 hypothetical protein [Seleniivibrio sp.]